MARFCEVTGLSPLSGNNVSHSNRKLRRRWLPNVRRKKYFFPELNQTYTLMVSTRAIRTIDKHGGITSTLFEVPEEKLSTRLQRVKHQILKRRRQAAQTQQAPA